MVESSSAGSSMKSPPPLQHGTQQESWAENKSCTTQQKHCCISSRGCSWWSLQHRHLTKVALEEKSNSGPTHRHDKYERALEQSHQIQYQQICRHNMAALNFTIIPAAKWRSSQCTPKLICPTRQESKEKVVSYPTRWSLLFIFWFLYGSSNFVIQATEKYSAAMS